MHKLTLGTPAPIIQTWPGGTPGTPPVQTWDGVPPTQTWDRVPPPRPGMGYPHADPQTWDGVPPLKVEQTHTCENITSRRTYYVRGR